MNENEKAAYVQAQATAALIEAMAMVSENFERYRKGQAIAYNQDAFMSLLDNYGLHHNNLMFYFMRE